MPRPRASGSSAGLALRRHHASISSPNATPAHLPASALLHERNCTARDRRAHVRRLKLKRI
ncbi:hypothetical protein EZV77_26795 [Burkholderia thailandensis]|nr:hypothetical protein A8H31_12690 [Burkholderia thailandensis]AVR28264.1 hypothetical protein A8H32_25425 [Burkholderia thailandensis]AWY62157.1 hypothetical protein A8H35_29755 [Burkholderia thailandensis]AWY64195.1 hypothetical protein A8H36_01955 [Burkholderia thailandensis]MDD1483895.1 hypothetical protein [Burkholderia thailandensis]